MLRKKREQTILLKLDEMEVLSRSQIQKILHIDNVRTINLILSSMSPYLNHMRFSENAYYLNKKGREYVGSTNAVNKTNQLEHKLMRNDLRIYYDYPHDWKNEAELIVTINGKKQRIIADASFTIQGTIFFVEVDNKQTMVNNYKKIDFYAEAFRVIENRTGNEPMLIFYTNSEIRKEKILAYATDKGITAGVFTKRDLQ